MQPLNIVLLCPADIAPYVATMANITAWLKRKNISALQQEESSWPNICLVQTMGSTWLLVCFAKNYVGQTKNKFSITWNSHPNKQLA